MGDVSEESSTVNENIDVRVGGTVTENVNTLVGDVIAENSTTNSASHELNLDSDSHELNLDSDNHKLNLNSDNHKLSLDSDSYGVNLDAEEIVKADERENENISETEEHKNDSPEEMINLPDTFFDDLMDVDFLGSFDVVDSWKQDEEDTEDRKSEGNGGEQNDKESERTRHSKANKRDRRVRDDKSRHDRSSKYERRRTSNNFWFNKYSGDKNKPLDEKSQYNSRPRTERSRSRSKKDGMSTVRSGTEKNASRSRRDRSTSRSRRRSGSKHKKYRSSSRSRKERSSSRSRKERSSSRSRKERSSSRSRKERSSSRSRKERSNSRSRKERSSSRTRKERSSSRSKIESLTNTRKENNVNIEIETTETENKEFIKVKSSYDLGKETIENQNQGNSFIFNTELPMKDPHYGLSIKVSSEPAPPGVDDFVPPGEELVLIKPNLETHEKKTNVNQEEFLDQENCHSDKNVSLERREQEEKNEVGSPVKLLEQIENVENSEMEPKPIETRTSRFQERSRTRERTRERSKENYDTSERDLGPSRKRAPIVVGPSYSRNYGRRSVSANREPRGRTEYRSKENPTYFDESINRDIRNFNYLRRLEKQDKVKYNDYLGPDKDFKMRSHRERIDEYSTRHRSPSFTSLSPISLSPVRSRYSRPPSRSYSRSRHRSRDRRHRRSYSPRSNDSLRSLSLSLSSESSKPIKTHLTKSRVTKPRLTKPRKRSKRRPFYEEITQKLGIQTNSSQHHPYLQEHEMAGGVQQAIIPYPGGPGYSGPPGMPPGPMAGGPPGPMTGLPPGPMTGFPPGPMTGFPPGPMTGAPPSVYVPPPNIHVPPPTHIMTGPPQMMGGPPGPQEVSSFATYAQPQLMDAPGPGLVPNMMSAPPPFLSTMPPQLQDVGAAPTEPVFTVQSNTIDPSSLSSYLEAKMKGDTRVVEEQPREKVVGKAGEDSKLGCVKPQVVARCEEAVAAVRAENALSMVPLGRVIVQPKASGSTTPYSVDQVSCFRSPLFDLSNPSYSFTTAPLHDFVPGSLKTAARKLRRSEVSKQLALRKARDGPGSKLEDSARCSEKPKCFSVAVNTDICNVDREWCCKCQAYNLHTSASRALGKREVEQDRHASGSKKRRSQQRTQERGHGEPSSKSGNDSDVQIVSYDAPQPNIPSSTLKGILKSDRKPPGNESVGKPPGNESVRKPPGNENIRIPPGNENVTVAFPIVELPSGNPAHLVVGGGPVHGFASFPHLAPRFQNLTLDQFQKFSAGFLESQRKFKESVRNASNN